MTAARQQSVAGFSGAVRDVVPNSYMASFVNRWSVPVEDFFFFFRYELRAVTSGSIALCLCSMRRQFRVNVTATRLYQTAIQGLSRLWPFIFTGRRHRSLGRSGRLQALWLAP